MVTTVQVMNDVRGSGIDWSTLDNFTKHPGKQDLNESEVYRCQQTLKGLSGLLDKADRDSNYAEKLGKNFERRSRDYTLDKLHEVRDRMSVALRKGPIPDAVPIVSRDPPKVVDAGQFWGPSAQRDLAEMKEGLSQIRLDKQRGLNGEIDADEAVRSIKNNADRIGSIAAGVREKLTANNQDYKNVFGGINPFSEAKGVLKDAERAGNTDLATLRLQFRAGVRGFAKLGGEQ